MTRQLLIAMGLTIAGTVGLAATPTYPDRTKLLEVRDAEGKVTAVRTADDWARRKAHILAGMQEVMGPLPDPKSKVDLDVKVIGEVDEGAYVRRQITFQAEKGDRVPAYLLLPKGKTGKRPAMLCLHQTTRIGKGEPAGLGGLAPLHYAKELAQRGFVCLVPDYPSFGDYAFDFKKSPHPSGSIKAVWNNIRGVDLLSAMAEVDAERIGVIGHSLGGHNALFTAAFEPRLKVAVTSCGFTRFPRYYGGKLKGWTSDRYMPRIATAYDLSPAKVPFDFPEILGAIAPRAVFICAPTHDSNFDRLGVEESVAAARPVFDLLGAKERLVVVYPEAQHTFPKESREAAYAFVEKVLK